MVLISSEVKYRVTDHNIDKSIRERDLFDGSNLKVFCRESRSQRSGKPSYVLYAIAVQVERKDLAAFAQEMDQVAPIPASSIENTHSRFDIPSENLIEDVNVNLSKLLLNIPCHALIIAAGRPMHAASPSRISGGRQRSDRSPMTTPARDSRFKLLHRL